MIILRTNSEPVLYVKELHGVVFVTWVFEKEYAGIFPTVRYTADQWCVLVSKVSGRQVIADEIGL